MRRTTMNGGARTALALGAAAGAAGVGAVVGLVMSMGWPTRRSALGVVATAGALIAANAPMTVLRVNDPTTWTAGDWATDVVPHLAYGATVAAVLHRFAANR